MSLNIHHIVFAALMHDIGKLVQRSGAEDIPKYLEKCRKDPISKAIGYKHAMWTADFLNRHPLKLPSGDWDVIVELAGSHHCKDSWRMHNLDTYLDMIMQADRISSGWDREPEENSNDNRRYLKVPLYSVFSCLGTDANPLRDTDSQWSYPLRKLSPDSVYPVKSPELKEQTAAYKTLLEGFERDYSGICTYFNGLTSNPNFEKDHFPQFIAAVDSLLKRYLWCIPANTMEKSPVGSLYHHLHNSATIAAALFAKQNSSVPDAEPPFMIVSADLNGIQSYLYDLNPENSSKASKLLRSRSFQIQMIMEMAAHKVISELRLSHMSIFSEHGGKWFILANHSPENEARLEKLKAEFNEELFKRFLGSVSINLSWNTRLGLADLDKKHFLKTIDRCFDDMEREKHAKFAAYLQKDGKWQSENFLINHENIYNDQICDFCKRRNSDQDSIQIYQRENPDDGAVRVCSQCLKEVQLGKHLAKERQFMIWQGKSNDDTYISFAGLCFGKADNREMDDLLPGAYYFSLNGEELVLHVPTRYLATQVPRLQDGRVATFEDIAQTATGLKANATLKGDVDNLGYIMSRSWPKKDQGEPECSITEYATLSFLMDYFFSATLPHLIREKDDKSIYTVYSGGDDFVLIGAYDKMIEFAQKLNQQFGKFCAENPGLHFSAAITLSHSKEPVKFVIKSTDARLDDAKNETDKNCLNLYESTVSWIELPALLEFSAKLLDWLNNDEITLQFLYRLLGYHQMYMETRCNPSTNLHNYLYDSLLNYDIKRNIEKKTAGQISNLELVNTLKNLTGLQEGSMMEHLRIPLCHAIYKNRNTKKGASNV